MSSIRSKVVYPRKCEHDPRYEIFRETNCPFMLYPEVANDFHAYPRTDTNLSLKLITACLGVWGMVQFLVTCSGESSRFGLYTVYAYAALVYMSSPWWAMAALHTSFIFGGCLTLTPAHIFSTLKLDEVIKQSGVINEYQASLVLCGLCFVVGYAVPLMQYFGDTDVAYLAEYKKAGHKYKVGLHTLWYWSLVFEASMVRSFFLPSLFPPKAKTQ